MTTDPQPTPAEKPNTPPKPEHLRVGGGTDAHKLASAIAGAVERKHECLIEYIGAGAGNQAIKAIIIANSILASQARFITVLPSFVKRGFADNPQATAIILRVHTHDIK
jgi:stage V sporulation protein S